MRALLVAALALLAGCGAVTHPRYSPELEHRWPECQRIVVVPGTIHAETKNYKTDDWFLEPEKGKNYGQLLAQAVSRTLRDRSGREPRVAAEAAEALGGAEALARTVADRLIDHAREWMARDPGYASERLVGLASEPKVVPEELRRGFDAIAVVGGRTKCETERGRNARYGDIILRNAVAYPMIMLSPLIPPLLPISLATLGQGLGGYWVGAPNVSYFSVAIFDARTGRLLYANDWFRTEKVDDEESFDGVARDLLRPIARLRGSETAPLGTTPDHWEP